MVGLPNHRVIPAGWQAAHRPTAESTMTGVCRIHTADGPPEYPSQTPTPGALYADGVPCRIQQQVGERDAEAATQQVHTRDYLVTVPLALFPDVPVTDTGPYLTLTGYLPGHDGDPTLVGRALKVTSIQRGTLLWERDLVCTDDLTNGGT